MSMAQDAHCEVHLLGLRTMVARVDQRVLQVIVALIVGWFITMLDIVFEWGDGALLSYRAAG